MARDDDDAHVASDFPIYRVLDKIEFPTDPDDCWTWVGATTGGSNGGYPEIRLRDRPAYVTRLIYEAEHGELAPGHQMHHKCFETRGDESRRCVNPAHLECLSHGQHMALHRRLRAKAAA